MSRTAPQNGAHAREMAQPSASVPRDAWATDLKNHLHVPSLCHEIHCFMAWFLVLNQ